MTYYLFIDESGDHGLHNVDSNFPVFLLCGILYREDEYFKARDEINVIKKRHWGNKDVILHSRDIRKCEKEFQILFDLDIKKDFIEGINDVIANSSYTVLASAIDKIKYIKKFGKLSNDVYELALSFIIERAIYRLDETKDCTNLNIVVECRGKKEDKKLDEHFQRLLARGTGYVKPDRLSKINTKIHFRDKKKNVNGLQLADLVAYPCARHVIDPNRANPAFDILAPKIYTKNGKRYGLKIFP